MKILIFITAGLGDTLLMLPLLKKLRNDSTHLSGIFSSPASCEDFFNNSEIFDEKVIIRSGWWNYFHFIISNLFSYDFAIIHFICFSRKNFLLARLTSRKIISSRQLRIYHYLFKPGFKYVAPVTDIHDATQYARLWDQDFTDSQLNEDLMRLPLSHEKIPPKKVLFDRLGLPFTDKYSVLQISAAGNKGAYKNWPIEYWIKLLSLLGARFPGQKFILAGDKSEMGLVLQIQKASLSNVSSTVGMTSIPDVTALIEYSEFYLGVDGGLLHLAAALGKPSFSIWGGSDFNLYGPQKINPEKHWICHKQIDCRPCNSWIKPNTLKVSKAAECKDISCLQNLSVEEVFQKFIQFYTQVIISHN